MPPSSQTENQEGSSPSAIDPISRQILQRTQTSHKIPQTVQNALPPHTVTASDEPSDRRSADSEALRRSDTVSIKATKDKKKGVSFLSRIIGNKKREDNVDFRDNASEMAEDRSGGNDAELFSQPVGFIPKFPAPPRYIRVKAQHRKKRDYDRLFLAQILLDPQSTKGRRGSSQVDEKIHHINDNPTPPPPNSSSKSRDNAIWAAEFSKDGKYFAAAGQDRKLRVWEVISSKDAKEDEDQSESGSEGGQSVKLNAPVFKQKLIREYDGHTAAILDLSWSKNNFLLSSSMDKTVRLYHVSRTECLCAFKHNDFVTSIQFHPRDDRFFLAGSLDTKLRLWSIPDKSVAYWAQVPDMITAVAFTPDGKTAIAGTLSGICILYATEGLKAHSQIHVRSTRGKNTKGSKITGIDTIAIPREVGQPDVKLLITSNDSRIRMYNLKDRTLEVKFRGNENACSQIRAYFSDDGKFVICGSEDRKVYIWPTGSVEKADTDRRPLEVFEAHSQIVTTALLAPTNTRKLLAQTGDPIYDICNPPPVVLLSRTDSVLSSPANTTKSGTSDEKQILMNGVGPEAVTKPPESPSYIARHTHQGGHIIVTADYSGQIKVFRQDCAYQKRRENSWDTGSTFSKRMLARSGSITPRTSIASSNHRTSISLTNKNPSTDIINNWRDGIINTNSTSDVNSGRTNSIRSISPRRSFAARLTLRNSNNHSGPNSAEPSPKKIVPPHMSAPDIMVQSPTETRDGSPHSPPDRTNTSPQKTPAPRNRTNQPFVNGGLSPVGESRESPSSSKRLSTLLPFDKQHSDDNPLFLVGDQSYQAWDMRQTMLPMLEATPRTPGLMPDENRLSRQVSIVSQLSSDLPTPNEDELEAAAESGHLRIVRPQHARNASNATATSANEEEELKCKGCGSETFRVIRVEGGGRGLKCRQCSAAV